MTLDETLTRYREEAAVLRRNGHGAQADTLERCLAAVQHAADDYLRWLDEDEAMLASGHAQKWFRARYATWAQFGHARRMGRTRQYRAVVVPVREQVAAAVERGRAAAKLLRAAA